MRRGAGGGEGEAGMDEKEREVGAGLVENSGDKVGDPGGEAWVRETGEGMGGVPMGAILGSRICRFILKSA